ncbi:TonB-dependent receptor domain-containing protein [Bradyrhizobium sp. PMVTL-01]|uniref:TonB-dependent receptor domain-containing protein n=1 Tax=Bradyrhizobium sp. PMVTL-01 TaxID=3434999 RepID=UPI003F6F25F6
MSISNFTGRPAPSRICAQSLRLISSRQRWRCSALIPGVVVALLANASASTQSPQQLEPVTVRPPKPHGTASRPGQEPANVPKRTRRAAQAARPKPATRSIANSEPAPTPLNSNVVATSSNLLGLSVFQTPATVEVVSQQTMREQGYRTTPETVAGAVGVLAVDVAGAPSGFSTRGFSFGEVTVLYNGLWIGPQSITSRVLDTANLEQVEFVKGPLSLMSGLATIGGSVNYVSRQPTSGPIKNELDTSIDTLGTYRTHFGSGGSTSVDGLDYRFDVSSSKINSFIEGDYQQLNNISGQLNYRVTDSFKVFGAIEYNQDYGHAYWGTPLTTTTFSGPFSTHGVVAGSAISTFDGSVISPVTVDSRTLRTNYNVADNSIGSHGLWLRGGFEWALNEDITIKNQAYEFGAKRHWFDSETYAFNTGTSMIDRDRFFVNHKQQVIGDNTDLIWSSSFFGMQNRFATQLAVSRNEIQFAQEQNPDEFPFDSVTVVNPAPGLYSLPPQPGIRNSRLDDAAITVEDQLKITPMLALIGGIRVEDMTLTRDGINFDGTIPAGQPFTKNWQPVSYRAAVTFEPIKGLLFYGMYATAYDPAAAGIFSVTPGTTLDLTSARIYETGVKAISADKRAEFTFSVYDIERRNVYVALTNAVATEAGEVHSKGVELAGAVRPIENLKIWGNIAITQATYGNFDVWTGNTPSNVAPVIINAGASYRFDGWRWPVEIGGAVRYVGQRYLFEDNLTAMLPYTTADLFAFVDISGRDLQWQGLEKMRVGFRVRNVTNSVYAVASDPGYPDQVYLGAPRTFELSASAKW